MSDFRVPDENEWAIVRSLRQRLEEEYDPNLTVDEASSKKVVSVEGETSDNGKVKEVDTVTTTVTVETTPTQTVFRSTQTEVDVVEITDGNDSSKGTSGKNSTQIIETREEVVEVTAVNPNPEEPLPAAQPGKKTAELTDVCILRFLRGRKGDVDKAYRALWRTLQWRAENKVSSITEADVEVEIKKEKVIVEGTDAVGRSCLYVAVRNHRKDDRDLETMKKFIIFLLEKAIRNSNPESERLILVFDMYQFGFSCMDYDVVKLLIEILQFNYPETLGMAVILNAPMIFSACWAIIRPWLDPDTAKKVLFANAAQLKTYIPLENIPKAVKL